MIGDGICQDTCNNAICLYDLHDCNAKRTLTIVSVTNTTLIQETTAVKPDNYGTIAGVGLGVFLTIIAMIIGIILCVIGAASPVFFVFLLLGILVPLITFLIVALAPLHKNQQAATDTRTDTYITARILFLITVIIFSLIALAKIFEYNLGINLRAKGVNSNIPQITSIDVLKPPQANPPVNDEHNAQNPLLAPQEQPLGPQNQPLGLQNQPLGPHNPLLGPQNQPLGHNPLLPGPNQQFDPHNPFLNLPGNK